MHQRTTVYQIATVDEESVPHVRSHMHRDILYPVDSPERPVILTTTDVRAPKVTQMLRNSRVELVWRLAGSQDQFRIAGFAHVVPSSTHPSYDAFKPASYLDLSKFAEHGFNWEKKRKEVWNEMSGPFRALWCTPDPGSHLASHEEQKNWPQSVPKLGEAKTAEEKKNQEISLQNFALVFIEPVVVDWVQVGCVPNQRTKWTRKGSTGEWTEEIVVP
ncbi:hypothetical protein A0H81_11476 [Grifola frondosa]|uniref:Pyridoxamine 5'-phosphate oxidase Alr4036 family FMN-binding domain-containing protein n=1 Tax=Grifola frondosa TaxID=5627 RepID=A0A1C7LVD5_GRIFR|nr:hypothetical protein A0H81_11476 [Grifola frondosa]